MVQTITLEISDMGQAFNEVLEAQLQAFIKGFKHKLEAQIQLCYNLSLITNLCVISRRYNT